MFYLRFKAAQATKHLHLGLCGQRDVVVYLGFRDLGLVVVIFFGFS